MPTRPVVEKLENARRDLLDLSLHNRLLNTPFHRRTTRLDIVGERTQELFRILIAEGKPMRFRPGLEVDSVEEQEVFFASLEDDEDHLTDNWLQTRLPSDALQTRLLKLFRDARTFREEQGVNILFLAMGFLKWFESDSSDRELLAPLILVPVDLDRKTVRSHFQLRFTGDELCANFSLQERLRNDFGLELPDLVPDAEDFSPEAYFDEVASAIGDRHRWELKDDDIVLWFFSFAKFLMYRDLHPEVWPENNQIDDHALVSALLDGGFPSTDPAFGEGQSLDECVDPQQMVHIVDADSSQSIVIEEARAGRNLVVQGPPGTGKSQTIANLIAAAVNDGKSVLFVAEKMAALEVVKRRLDGVGLGDMCLELHSQKSNKKAVLEELERTLKLGKPETPDRRRDDSALASCRQVLNQHSLSLHTPLVPSDRTPYEILGELIRLRAGRIGRLEFRLEGALSWSRQDVADREQAIADLASHLRAVGDPTSHSWRGVGIHAAVPSDIDRLISRIDRVGGELMTLSKLGTELASHVQRDPPCSLRDVSAVAKLAKRVSESPPADHHALANAAWREERERISWLVECGVAYRAAAGTLDRDVAQVAWETDVSSARRGFSAHGRSWFRWLFPSWRVAKTTLAGILKGTLPSTNAERIAILDRLIDAQRLPKELGSDAANRLGEAAFGTRWNGHDSDWEALKRIHDWDLACRDDGFQDHATIVAAGDFPERADALVREVGKRLKPAHQEIEEIFAVLKLDTRVAFRRSRAATIEMDELCRRFQVWTTEAESLSRWMGYAACREGLTQLGMGELMQLADSGEVSVEGLLPQFRSAYFDELVREVFRLRPELSAFDGLTHELRREQFAKLDRDLIEPTRYDIAKAHHQRYAGLQSDQGNIGEIKTLKHEIKKKRRHIALRSLLQKAGGAVQAIKPVFMMSPVSIAQFLEPGGLKFDLLLIDEASQVRPVDAIGAVARASQMVVVGDDRQLPPTSFFARIASGDPDEEDEAEANPRDLESILGLCEAQNMPQRMLRWHYRSRHHSLIAVSNREFYENGLLVVPSPQDISEELGLSYHLIDDGFFDRGGSVTNRREALQVALAVVEHAQTRPQKSLGVGTFSVKQRDAILDELERLRREHTELEPFFARNGTEPFFVKNLENIQGDERDVILISVAYAADSTGKVSMNFGPLNSDGGERRLNVLISRARERCVVFTSMPPEQIDLNRTQSRGVRALKSFLSFARDGVLSAVEESTGDFDSVFERQVARAIERTLEFDVQPQIGVAGFRVDLGVVDPNEPGRYLLGIECDGASYHSARSARDRDRIRQQVLEDRGWRIHRVWSTDWFRRPEEQLRKIDQAIQQAMAARDADQEADSPQPSVGQPPIPRDAVGPFAGNEPVESVPYVEAAFETRSEFEIHDLPTPILSGIVVRIVAVEGPIHEEEVARRTAQLWGKRRVGNRIAGAVDEAVRHAVSKAKVSRDGAFLDLPNRDALRVRDRSMAESASLRQADRLPPAETREAVRSLLGSYHSVDLDEMIGGVARLFGFEHAGSAIRATVSEQVHAMVASGTIEQDGDRLRLLD